MTIAEKLRQEGLQEGRQEGHQEERLEAARRMLSMGAEDAFVLRAANVTKQQLEQIKKERRSGRYDE